MSAAIATPAAAAEADDVLHALSALGAEASSSLRAAMRELLMGRLCPARPPALPALSPEERMEAAELLCALGRPEEAIGLLSTLSPRRHPRLIPTALRALPELSRDAVFSLRRFCSELVFVALQCTEATAMRTFLWALHDRGHMELLDALRGSDAGRALRAEDAALLDATRSLWLARPKDVLARLDGLAFRDEDASEAALLSAAARGLREPSATVIAELSALSSAPFRARGLREIAARFHVEFLLRTSNDPEIRLALNAARDHPALRLLHRIWILLQQDERSRTIDARQHAYVLSALVRHGVATAAIPEGAPLREEIDALWETLRCFGGNRTDACTLLRDGALVPEELLTARQHCVALQAGLPADGPEAVLGALDRAAQEHGDPLFRTYRAEVLVWLGRYEEAIDVFEQVWRSTHTRWSAIGRGAALSLLGRDDEALSAWDEGHQFHHGALHGEATLVYRAELLLRRGMFDAALRLAEEAVSGRPTRLRAWVLLAELYARTGDEVAARRALAQAVALCPGLFYEDRAALATIGGAALASLCEKARTRLRGNASSWMFTWEDGQRSVRAFRRAPARELVQVFTAVR